MSKAEILRLIYQGRFLHSNVTLGALGLPFGKTTVMHLVPRENLPEPNSQGGLFGEDRTQCLLILMDLFQINDKRAKAVTAVVAQLRAASFKHHRRER